MLDFLPSENRDTSAEYRALLWACIFDDFKFWNDMAIGAAVAVITVVLQARLRLISVSDWQEHESRWIISVVLPFVGILLIHLSIRAIRAPYVVHNQREQSWDRELTGLRAFKREVEENEVQLFMAKINHSMTAFGNSISSPTGHTFQPVENAETVSVTFENPRASGMPGKEAKNVLARIKYIDSTGKAIEHEGRWNELDQPGARSFAQSTNDLLRIDFKAGDRHALDIVAKFASGCFAVNNDSLRGEPKSPDKLLQGLIVHITVSLIAQYVNQTFEFELSNPVNGPMDLVQVS